MAIFEYMDFEISKRAVMTSMEFAILKSALPSFPHKTDSPMYLYLLVITYNSKKIICELTYLKNYVIIQNTPF